MSKIDEIPLVAACEQLRQLFVDAFSEFARVSYEPQAWRDEAAIVRTAKDARVLLTRSLTPVTASLLQQLDQLECVAVYGAGREHLDLDALAHRGIHVIRCSQEVAGTVAEFTLGLALCLLRRIHEAALAVERGQWDHNTLVGQELAGKRVLVVGCGPIGSRVALLFSSLGARVAVARKSNAPLPLELVSAGCVLTSLEEQLPESDLITLHVPGGVATRNLIAEREIALMPAGAFLINTSRGSVVDLKALTRAVQSGRLGGAALDVLPVEPPDTPLPVHPRVIYTPHVALYAEEAIERRIKSVVTQVRLLLDRAMELPCDD